MRGGFPHSEIPGSKPARGSPKLIATCYVLHRLSVPRHPPDALQTLDLNSNENACATRRNKPAREPVDRTSCFRRSMLLPARISPGRGASSVTCTSSSLVHDPASYEAHERARSARSCSRCRVVVPSNGPRSLGGSFAPRHQHSSRKLVEADGIEPTTSCLQSRRSPN